MKTLIFKDDAQSIITLWVNVAEEAVHFRIDGDERSSISKSSVTISDIVRSEAFNNLVELGNKVDFNAVLAANWFQTLYQFYNHLVATVINDYSIGREELIASLQEHLGPEEEEVYDIIINIAIEWSHSISEMLAIEYYGNNLYKWDGNEYLVLHVDEAEERIRDTIENEYEDIAEEVPCALYDYIDRCGWINDRISSIAYEDYLSSTGEEHTLSDDYYAYPQ